MESDKEETVHGKNKPNKKKHSVIKTKRRITFYTSNKKLFSGEGLYSLMLGSGKGVVVVYTDQLHPCADLN